MTVARDARRAAAALAFGVLLAGCQITSVVVDNGVPDQPSADIRVGPAIVVAQGNGDAGPYRAWVYRTTDGLTCFELASTGMSSAGCGPGDDGALGIAPTSTDDGWFVGGGTRQPATVAVLRTQDGAEHRAPVAPAPGGVTPGIRYVAIGVTGSAPVSMDLLDDTGALLETVAVDPGG